MVKLNILVEHQRHVRGEKDSWLKKQLSMTVRLHHIIRTSVAKLKLNILKQAKIKDVD